MKNRTPLPRQVHNVICGRKLEALRIRAGLTQKEVATLFGGSQPKLVSIESGQTSLNPNDLQRLLDIYDADTPSREYCVEHATAGRHWDRNNRLRSRFEGDMRDHIDLESTADIRYEHSSMIIPGLLQTEDYMRYLFRAGRPSPTQEQIDQFAEMRRGRQRTLDNVDQRFWFVIDEAALRRMANMDGGPSIMRRQIKHLVAALDQPNIEVQVVPFKHGYYLGQQVGYVVFGYDTDPAVQVVYVEQYDDSATVRDVEKVRNYLSLWDHQRAAALGPEQTRAFLAGVARSS
jgi:transcriptional regulator with XRE-family HTH domain